MHRGTAFASVFFFMPPMVSGCGVLFRFLSSPLPFVRQSLLCHPPTKHDTELRNERADLRTHCIRIASKSAREPFVIIGNAALRGLPNQH